MQHTLGHPLLTRATVLRTAAVHAACWAILAVLAGLGLAAEYARRGLPVAPLQQVLTVWLGTLALQALGVGLSCWWRLRPRYLDSGRCLVYGYAGMLVVLLPPELAYQAALAVALAGHALTPTAVLEHLRTEPKVLWLQCALYETSVYIVVSAAALWRHSRWRQAAWQQVQNENLQLRLGLEQQRIASLRSQLEPHFMFNALNALSALVRTGDKKAALAAITRLSELLRYTVSAGQVDWTTVGAELEFLDAYLALQKIRYGDRLQIQIDAAEPGVAAWECPPLLLQPLVENALRHDLDCHEEASDIRISIAPRGQALGIRICNTCRGEGRSNPGLGLGLANTRLRLEHAYRGGATFDCAVHDARFCVTLELPVRGDN